MSPRGVARDLWSHRELLGQLARRDVVGRYRGSYLGILWSLLNPIFMLIVYTFVFRMVFRARWGLEDEGRVDFALVLFCGLIVFNTFAECASRAPSLIVSSPQYVKKVRFPLQILPIVVTLSALTHAAVGFLVLLLGVAFQMGTPSWTLVFLPLLVLPLVLFCAGVGWFLSALGVFVRDIQQAIGIAVTALLFLSPIFYSASQVPEWLSPIYLLNPLSVIIEQTRGIVIWGRLPDWGHLLAVTLLSGLTAVAGYAWFQRTRRGFADVL
jgi:lipopolysaccharide transport system permease protein